MKDQKPSGRFPYGAVVLLLIAFLLYAGFAGNILGARDTDAAGRGMAMGFAAILGMLLWIVIGGLFIPACLGGRLPAWVSAAFLALLPLSAIAAAVAADVAEDWGDWLMASPLLLPPLLALYALWARFPRWHGFLPVGRTTAVMGGAIALLTAAPLALAAIESAPDPARQEEAARQEQQARDAEAASFARLGPESSLRDYLDHLPPGNPRSQEALAGAGLVKSREVDAVALLQEGRIGSLQDLWQLDIAAASVCEAYGAALQAQASKIDRARSDHIAVAIDLERQLPNIRWLAGAQCNIGEAITDLTARLRAVSDSPRIVAFADALAAIR